MNKKTLPLIFLIILIIILPLAVFLVGQRWAPKKAVELPSPIVFTPTRGLYNVGDEFIVNLFLNTENRPIDGLDIAITTHGLDIDFATRPLPQGLTYQQEPQVDNGKLTFSILTQPGQPFANNELAPILNLKLRPRVGCQAARLLIDKNFSVVAVAGQNILGQPVEPSFEVKLADGISNPQFTSLTAVQAVKNSPFTYTATATNPNNGNLQFSFYNLPGFLTANSPTVSGTPDRAGEYPISIEIVDGQGGSNCGLLALSVLDSTEPIAITNIRTAPSFNRTIITWDTNRGTTSQVEYGETSSYTNNSSLDSNLVTSHTVALVGLKDVTNYHFRVIATAPGTVNTISDDYTFITTKAPNKTLNIRYQFQGKKENQNNRVLKIWAKDTDFKKEFTGNADGTISLNIEGKLDNRETPYEILLKGYQNLTVKRTIPIHLGPNPAGNYLDFGQLPCGDIAPADSPDNMVNSLDWGYMVDEWNLEANKQSIADINSDNRVNSLDYSSLISQFGLKGEE